MQINFKTWAE